MMNEQDITRKKQALAKVIYAKRSKRWATQETAAWWCGVGKHTYAGIENRTGESRDYQISSLLRILDALGLDLKIVEREDET